MREGSCYRIIILCKQIISIFLHNYFYIICFVSKFIIKWLLPITLINLNNKLITLLTTIANIFSKNNNSNINLTTSHKKTINPSNIHHILIYFDGSFSNKDYQVLCGLNYFDRLTIKNSIVAQIYNNLQDIKLKNNSHSFYFAGVGAANNLYDKILGLNWLAGLYGGIGSTSLPVNVNKATTIINNIIIATEHVNITIIGWSRGAMEAYFLTLELSKLPNTIQDKINIINIHAIDPVLGCVFDRLGFAQDTKELEMLSLETKFTKKIKSQIYYSHTGYLSIFEKGYLKIPWLTKLISINFSAFKDPNYYQIIYKFNLNHEEIAGIFYNQETKTKQLYLLIKQHILSELSQDKIPNQLKPYQKKNYSRIDRTFINARILHTRNYYYLAGGERITPRPYIKNKSTSKISSEHQNKF